MEANLEKKELSKINNVIKPNLEKIRSKCILSKIFDYLKKTKSLKIIKYNKKVQGRLNITISNFKEISQTEIIVIPCHDKFGRFINIFNKKFEKYFHIYFNDSKEETKRNYLI